MEIVVFRSGKKGDAPDCIAKSLQNGWCHPLRQACCRSQLSKDYKMMQHLCDLSAIPWTIHVEQCEIKKGDISNEKEVITAAVNLGSCAMCICPYSFCQITSVLYQ